MKLFSSFQVKNMTLRNRTVMPPMCMYSAENGMPNAFHFTHYTSRAVGGVGLIIVEATGVQPNGRISDHCLGLWNDKQRDALAGIVSECQRLGAKVAVGLLCRTGYSPSWRWRINAVQGDACTVPPHAALRVSNDVTGCGNP